jgi:hypothetical protein
MAELSNEAGSRKASELHCVALADLRGSSVRGIISNHSRTAPASKTDKGCPMESELSIANVGRSWSRIAGKRGWCAGSWVANSTTNLPVATFHPLAAFVAQLVLLARKTVENLSASTLHSCAELLDVFSAGTPARVLGLDRRGECCKHKGNQRGAALHAEPSQPNSSYRPADFMFYQSSRA